MKLVLWTPSLALGGSLFSFPFSNPCPVSIYPHLFSLMTYEYLCLALRVLQATVLGDANRNSSVNVYMVI